MQDTHTGDVESRRSAPAPGHWSQPSSSRMLTTYLADVERMLDEQQWALALRDAVALPQIAVALTDPQMCTSSDRCSAWCTEWIRPAGAMDSAADQERICKILGERVANDPAAMVDGVPSLALRRLRLRRYARTVPRGFVSGRNTSDDPNAVDAVEICTAVVDGMRRWYAHCGCHDATAQTNLARLAVLR